MISRRILAAVALLCVVSPAHAQKTKAALTTEINTNWPDQTLGQITPALLRSTVLDIVNSYVDANGTSSLPCATHQWIASIATLSSVTCVQPAFTDISGSIAPTQIPNPTATTLGGIESYAPVGSQWINTISTAGVPSSSQPAIADISGWGTGVATALGIAVSGSGGACLITSCTMVTPTLGVATATSINKVAITAPASSATLTIADGTTLTETSSTSIGRGQYLGEASTGNATAGNIGEYFESVVASGSAVSLASGTAKDVTTLTLGAGDWDIDPVIQYVTGATTSVTAQLASISQTLNTLDPTSGRTTGGYFGAIVPTAGTTGGTSVPQLRFSLSGSTTFHLVAFSNFTVSTMTAYGIIRARRVR